MYHTGMRIPFSNRTADVDLPVMPGQAKVTVKSVIDSFRKQIPDNFSDLFQDYMSQSLSTQRGQT